MKIYNFEQNTPEWLAVRKLKLTASKAQAIASNGKGLETLALEILTDYYSSNTEHYINADMQRGHDLEPMARELYELETGLVTQKVGFIEIDKYLGMSPDSLVGDDGGQEIKALNDTNHMKAILYGLKGIESKYVWQCKMSILLSKRKWWDLTIFNPNFDRSLIIHRIELDKTSEEKLLVGIEKGKNLIRELQKKYES